MAGRPKGAWRDKAWRDAIRKAVCKRVEEGEHKGRQKLEVMADMLANAGVQGKLDAMREIGERLDGKSTQQVDTVIRDERMVAELPATASSFDTWASKHKPH